MQLNGNNPIIILFNFIHSHLNRVLGSGQTETEVATQEKEISRRISVIFDLEFWIRNDRTA